MAGVTRADRCRISECAKSAGCDEGEQLGGSSDATGCRVIVRDMSNCKRNTEKR